MYATIFDLKDSVDPLNLYNDTIMLRHKNISKKTRTRKTKTFQGFLSASIMALSFLSAINLVNGRFNNLSITYDVHNRDGRSRNNEPIYQNEFALYIPKGSDAADAVASKYGFDNLGQVNLEAYHYTDLKCTLNVAFFIIDW